MNESSIFTAAVAGLMLNWTDRTRRYLLLAAAISFYVLRVASARPTAFEWAELPSDTVVSGDLAAQIDRWSTLGLVRGVFQEWLVTALLVIATLRHRIRVTSPAV